MKKTLLLTLSITLSLLSKSQQIPARFYGINHWMPKKYIYTPNTPSGRIETPAIQSLIANMGSSIYRIGGDGYDSKGLAIGVDSVTNDYIRAMQIIRASNPGAFFLVQVHYKAPTFTKDSAFKLVNNVRLAFPGEHFYFAIGNEWDRYRHAPNKRYFSSEIAAAIKSFAVEMKFADPQIKIVAPALSYYAAQDSVNSIIMNDLIGGSSDISGLITGSTHTVLNGAAYYIDVIDFHTYGGLYGDLSGVTSASSYTASRAGLINYAGANNGYASELDNLITRLNLVNPSRAQKPITFAITEMNVCYLNQPNSAGTPKYRNTPQGLSAQSFFAGQYFADIMATTLKKGTAASVSSPKVEFIMPWSVHESSGGGGSVDLSLVKGPGSTSTPTQVSSYYHYQMMARYFTDKYFSSASNNKGPNVKTFASVKGNSTIYVMILNRDSVQYNFNLDLKNNAPSGKPLLLGYSIPSATLALDSNYVFNDSIAGNTTLVMAINQRGKPLWKMIYSLQNAMNNTGPTMQTYNAVTPGESLSFDGIDDYVIAGGYSNFTEYTIEGWFKLNSLSNQNLIVGSNSSGPNLIFSNQIMLSGGKFVHYAYDGTVKTVSSTATPTTGVWYHVAITGKNGTPLRINVNGTENSGSTNIGTLQGPITSYYLGSSANGTLSPFNGYMDEVRIWNRALCVSEINHNQNGEILPTGNGLLTNYRFNQGIANGINTATNILTDETSVHTGTLSNFALTGSVSNWIAPGAIASGVNVSAYSSPTISTQGNTLICNSGTSVTLTANGAGSYTWASGPNTNSFAVTPSVTSTYSVTGTDGLGCVSSVAIHTVLVNPAITITTLATHVNCNGNSTGAATLVTTGGTSPFVYLWSTGNTNSVISSLNAGVNTATITDANNCSKTTTITIIQPSVLSATTSVSHVSCNGGNNGSVSVTASGGTGPYSFLWSNSGTLATTNALSAGPITCTLTDANGCQLNIASAVTQPSALTLSISASSLSVCAGKTVVLIASGNGGTGNIAYNWFSGPTTATNTVTVNTTNAISVTATDANSCSTSASIVLSAVVLPTITVNSGSICAGQTFTLNAGGAASYSFSGGSNTVTPNTTTSYSVTGTSSTGCVSQNAAVSTITVNANPTIAVNSGSICAGQTFTLNASGAASYSFSGGSTTVTPNTTTSYSVTGTSSAGCVSQNAAVSIVTVNTNPTITVNSGSICAGQTFTLTASGATSYSFSGGSNTVTPNTTTSYSVTGTSSAGCVSQNAAVGTVTVNANPTITIASSNTLLCSGESVTITASGANSYSWSTLSGNASIVVSPTSNATYSVLGIDASGCMAIAALTQSVDPCTAIKKEKTINVTQIIRIYPNPNNGEFMVELNATGKVTISNMLGEIIFEGYQENGVFPMSLLHHSNGLYFLHFKNNRTSETVKIIKN